VNSYIEIDLKIKEKETLFKPTPPTWYNGVVGERQDR
jgi:hypothetical protein